MSNNSNLIIEKRKITRDFFMQLIWLNIFWGPFWAYFLLEFSDFLQKMFTFVVVVAPPSWLDVFIFTSDLFTLFRKFAFNEVNKIAHILERVPYATLLSISESKKLLSKFAVLAAKRKPRVNFNLVKKLFQNTSGNLFCELYASNCDKFTFLAGLRRRMSTLLLENIYSSHLCEMGSDIILQIRIHKPKALIVSSFFYRRL